MSCFCLCSNSWFFWSVSVSELVYYNRKVQMFDWFVFLFQITENSQTNFKRITMCVSVCNVTGYWLLCIGKVQSYVSIKLENFSCAVQYDTYYRMSAQCSAEIMLQATSNKHTRYTYFTRNGNFFAECTLFWFAR